MARVPLNSVRWMTLREIAQLWAPEADIPVDLMLRELQTAVINIPRLRAGENLLDMPVPVEELPDPDERVDRDWVIEFCGKQGWQAPSFWFERHEQVRRPGRPSVKGMVLAKFEERRLKGLTEGRISAEARAIHNEMVRERPGEKIPEAETIEGHIRMSFNNEKRNR